MALRLEHFKYHFALYLLLFSPDFSNSDNGKRMIDIYAENLFLSYNNVFIKNIDRILIILNE